MPDPREITDVAIDCALHQLPRPTNGWERLVTPEDLGSAVDAGSGQIGLQANVALLWYGEERTGDRRRAIAIAERTADVNVRRLFLSEPWSNIYGEAIILIWAAYVVICGRLGLVELAAKFERLLEMAFSTCALMEARITVTRPGANKWEKALTGRMVVPYAGCRSWGIQELPGSINTLWQVARGSAEPPTAGSKQYGTPGAYDDWGWLHRCQRIALELLRAIAAKYVGKTWQELLRIMPRWAARTEIQLIGYGDGSREFVLGDDETEFDDEDENGNTPARVYASIRGGRFECAPRWPNPANGLDHLRQKNVRTDIDGSPAKGWSVWSSDLGAKKSGDGFVTEIEAYRSAPVVFHVLILEGDLNWRDLLAGGIPTGQSPDETSPTPVPAPPAQPQKPPHRPRKKKWWEKLFDFLG